MPHVKIELTHEGVASPKKQVPIKGVTSLMSNVLNKHPQLTLV